MKVTFRVSRNQGPIEPSRGLIITPTQKLDHAAGRCTRARPIMFDSRVARV